AQVEDQRPQPAQAGRHRLLQAVEEPALAVVGELVAEGGQQQPGGGDGLDGVVVDLAGDAPALLLLGPHHPPEEPAALLVQADQPLVGEVAVGDAAPPPPPGSRGRCSPGGPSRSWARWRSVTSRSTTPRPVTRPPRSRRAVVDS